MTFFSSREEAQDLGLGIHNHFANLGLLFGIASISEFDHFWPPLIAIVLSGIGLKESKSTHNQSSRKIGLIQSRVGLVLGALYLIAWAYFTFRLG